MTSQASLQHSTGLRGPFCADTYLAQWHGSKAARHDFPRNARNKWTKSWIFRRLHDFMSHFWSCLLLFFGWWGRLKWLLAPVLQLRSHSERPGLNFWPSPRNYQQETWGSSPVASFVHFTSFHNTISFGFFGLAKSIGSCTLRAYTIYTLYVWMKACQERIDVDADLLHGISIIYPEFGNTKNPWWAMAPLSS